MITIKFDDHTITFNKDDTFGDVRKRIREILETKNKLRIKVLLDKPLRAFGKLNLEPGVLSPMLSAAKLDRFNIKGRLDLEVTVTDEVFIDSRKPKSSGFKSSGGSFGGSSGGTYEVHSRRKKKGMMEKEEYNYNKDDFPPLGQ